MSVPRPAADPIAEFLAVAGWEGARLAPLAGDASTRHYLRAEKPGGRAVLMVAPPAKETASCPPDADEAMRRALGYNAAARLAGPNLSAFLEIAAALKSSGLSAPEVFAADRDAGLALIEDLGDELFARTIGTRDEATLYAAAIDVLARLRAAPPARPRSAHYEMLDYDALALETEAMLLMEWYWPLKTGAPAPDDLTAEFRETARALIATLPPPSTFTLRDFHAENLIWMPDREGLARVGLIDFQDGLFGNPAYDLVSLLEDARRDVAPALADTMVERYLCAGDIDRDAFLRDYAILAAQRNAKILGIFARLAKRDGKPRYLDLLPRVEAHFRRDLEREAVAPLSRFFTRHMPELAS